MKRTVHIHYVAMLRDRTGSSQESITTVAANVRQLYSEIAGKYEFPWPHDAFRPAINDTIQPWTSVIEDNDRVLFLPPSSGG